MTTSVLRSSEGGGSRPPDGVSAAQRPPILAEMPQFRYRLTQAEPTVEETSYHKFFVFNLIKYVHPAHLYIGGGEGVNPLP